MCTYVYNKNMNDLPFCALSGLFHAQRDHLLADFRGFIWRPTHKSAFYELLICPIFHIFSKKYFQCIRSHYSICNRSALREFGVKSLKLWFLCF